MPDKLETKVVECKSIFADFSMTSTAGSNLSSGQQQLICLGRALMKKSTILLMDEATGIDSFM